MRAAAAEVSSSFCLETKLQSKLHVARKLRGVNQAEAGFARALADVKFERWDGALHGCKMQQQLGKNQSIGLKSDEARQRLLYDGSRYNLQDLG